jgi:transposase
MVERAKIILMSDDGFNDAYIANSLGIRPNTVGMWRQRFLEQRLDGLYDMPRTGKPPVYDPESTRLSILKMLEEPPPKGQATWDGASVAAALEISPHKVWRVLKKEGIFLQRQRSWCVSTDPEFAQKSADVIGLYLNPPENALVLSIDEKPSIQAIERATGYVLTSNKKIVQGIKSTYKRHGTINLFAALEMATELVKGKLTERKTRVDFLEFMDEVVADYQDTQEIHVIMDNYCIHKKCDEWLSNHPNVSFHFTPTSASWLNMVEIWFGIMSRKALKGASFNDVTKLSTAITDFIDVYNSKAEPFVWRKREVKGSQLKNTIVNLRN